MVADWIIDWPRARSAIGLGEALQLGIVEAAVADLHLHRGAGDVADALDGGRRDDQRRAVGDVFDARRKALVEAEQILALLAECREIVAHERIVSTEVFEGIPDAEAHAALNTLTLTEHDGRTTLTVLVQHPTKEGRDMHINSGMEGGMQEAMDLLEQVAVSLA